MDECKPLPGSPAAVMRGATRLAGAPMLTAGLPARGVTLRIQFITCCQGLTLVHLSAQHNHLVWAAHLHFSVCREHFVWARLCV